MKEEISLLIKQILLLSEDDKKKIIRELFSPQNLKDKKQGLRFLDIALVSLNQKKYLKIEKRVKELFHSNPKLKPVIVAKMVKYYLRIPDAMLPLIVKIAQRYKDRLRKSNAKGIFNRIE